MSRVPFAYCQPLWLPARRCRAALPATLREWLFDSASLTARLRQTCEGCFGVRLLHEDWRRPERDETHALGIRRDRLAWVRQVLLMCDGVPWVYGRTVIPAATLRGPGAVLTQLGARPLGEVLFSDPAIHRGEVEAARLAPQRWAAAGLVEPVPALWGRRSLFYLHQRPLLVTEIFLPPLLERLGIGE